MDTKKTIQVQILNAFVNNNEGGNPAGVVLDADHLTKDDKLRIAKQVGLSETAFVSHSDIADFKLDFFTPNKQIADCGHATVATFSYLKQLKKITTTTSSKETIDGPRHIKFVDDLAFMEQKAPCYTTVSKYENDILQSLNLKPTDVIENAPILSVNTGNSFVIVPVKNTEILKRITPNLNSINKISDDLDLIGFYVFTTDSSNLSVDATTRMFAPRYGISEEAATGMAAGPLATYLYDKLHVKKDVFTIHQGYFMEVPSPSKIQVELQLENNKITGLMAGGKGVLQSQMEVFI